MALRLGGRDFLQQRLAPLGRGGDAQAIVVEDLDGAALAGIEIADEAAGRHLVELDARQFAQRIAALPAQAFGIGHGRAQRAVELALLAAQLGDGALDRAKRLSSGPHQRGLTTG